MHRHIEGLRSLYDSKMGLEVGRRMESLGETVSRILPSSNSQSWWKCALRYGLQHLKLNRSTTHLPMNILRTLLMKLFERFATSQNGNNCDTSRAVILTQRMNVERIEILFVHFSLSQNFGGWLKWSGTLLSKSFRALVQCSGCSASLSLKCGDEN